jgi:NAD(P)-dependent dehydrogenase (short-subunit alcohol dehydrogenase family)
MIPQGLHLFDLTGKTALVTGGGRGLGRAIAIGLAQAGADVIVASRTTEQVMQVSREITQCGRASFPLSMDVTQEKDVARAIQEVKKQAGTLDILVNAAGMNIRKPTLEYSEEEWDRVLDSNLKGTFFCSKYAAEIMMENGHGKIINISSLGAEIGLKGISPYSASKGGVRQLTKAMALEWAPIIHVNAIVPGYYKTELTRQVFENEENRRWIESRIPWGRAGEPEDLAGAAVFLASRASDYVTGHSLFVDGGWLAG